MTRPTSPTRASRRRKTVSHEFDARRAEWIAREELAERMIPLIGGLYRDHGVVTSIHGRRLINRSAIALLKAHRFARQAGDEELAPRRHDARARGAARDRSRPGVDRRRPARRALRATSGAEGERMPLVDFLRAELAPVLVDRRRRARGIRHRRRALRLRPHRTPARPHPHRPHRRRPGAAPARDRRAQGARPTTSSSARACCAATRCTARSRARSRSTRRRTRSSRTARSSR